MPKIKSDAEMQAHIDKEYPSQTSPPEVLSLKAWVREIEEKRGDKPQVGAFMDTTKKSIE
jgi:hypothetical protein